MGRLDNIQIALKPIKKSEKIETHFMSILGLYESIETMNQPDPTLKLFTSLFLGKYKIYCREIFTQTSFMSLKCAIKIWHRYL